MQTKNTVCVQVAGKCSGGLVAENRCPPRYPTGGFGFIVAEELHDFSGTMAVFAIESPFWRIVPEKEPCFSVTMINK